MTKAENAKRYHADHGITCRTCTHFKTAESRFAKITYCDLYPVGRGRFADEFCSLWEEKHDAG